jgi:hypothetical protein
MIFTTELSNQAGCNTCGYRIDSATSIEDGNLPFEGDVSLCIACGAIEIFIESPDGLVTRPSTQDEYDKILKDEKVKTAVAYIAVKKILDPDWPKGDKSDS